MTMIKKLLVSLSLLAIIVSAPAHAQLGMPSPLNPPGIHQGIPGVINMEILYGNDDNKGNQQQDAVNETDSQSVSSRLHIIGLIGKAILLLLALLGVGICALAAVASYSKDRSKTKK